MANYHIGLDFGTSQTKVCLLNKDSGIREFIKFNNDNYFLPSLIVKKADNTFSYGNDFEHGCKYRYFKMAAAEDDTLIQVTNEDLDGNLINGTIDDFRKYSTDFEIKPEFLVVLYLAYIYLYIIKKKKTQATATTGGLLGRLIGKKTVSDNTFSINLGIPTEWNNPDHIKRKIKFQSLLLTALTLANQFGDLDNYLKETDTNLLNRISEINKNHLNELEDKTSDESTKLIKKWLSENKLSVFPESAAGVNYLLQTKRLATGIYATLDIGAGTSDIAIFEVNNNTLNHYYCSESVEIASNDFYREYAKQINSSLPVSFEVVKKIENIIRNGEDVNRRFYQNACLKVRGYLNGAGIQFAIRKTFYRKYYHPLHNRNQVKAFNSKEFLNDKPIIVFGGGANLDGFCSGDYCFYQGSNPLGNQDRNFKAKPITDYINQVEISDDNDEIKNYINLLVLALGLTYCVQNGDYIPFAMPATETEVQIKNRTFDRYFYYDLQEAVYK